MALFSQLHCSIIELFALNQVPFFIPHPKLGIPVDVRIGANECFEKTSGSFPSIYILEGEPNPR